MNLQEALEFKISTPTNESLAGSCEKNLPAVRHETAPQAHAGPQQVNFFSQLEAAYTRNF